MKEFKEQISIPSELDEAILTGIKKGKIKMEKRNNVKKNMLKTAAVFIIGIGVFTAGINVSPAFADSMRAVPVLGTLVQIFQVNKAEVSGGQTVTNAKGEIFLKKQEGKEQLIINFANSEKASRYSATYQKDPQSITVALPGTTDVTLLSDYKRSEGESAFIKSVYKLMTLDDSMVRYVVEIEDYSNVQVSEYKNPGQIVIEITKNENYTFHDIYSVRSYSFKDGESFAQLEEKLKGQKYRILKDEQEKRFFEFAQFDSKDKAEKFAKKFNKIDTLIEVRYGNNVPVCFNDASDYEKYNFTLMYVEFLREARTPEDIIRFIDKNKEEYPQYLELMLKGLTGMLRGMDSSQYDSKALDKYYKLIGTTTQEELNKY
ncbi:hypothetical protein [Aminipila terrae]|uniref:DUF4179 domain-containing protein n=1 Tax=Aminipila terrae TaxID=2697030 RepID=A0A6P1MCN5_9FIRM|nr:hypothetical protein [Aminipila terrae]QHI71601.1 hypothetical protein Ami3637_03685 [Aminipila terrae]